jgi:EPS-associated MarR family transcriptional regulator
MTIKTTLQEETHLKVLRLLQANPTMNQRELAVALGVSLGKANFCLQALVEKGLLKMQNFKSSKKKAAYAYLLTPTGLAEKAALTRRFLIRTTKEYELLKAEIELLNKDSISKL